MNWSLLSFIFRDAWLHGPKIKIQSDIIRQKGILVGYGICSVSTVFGNYQISFLWNTQKEKSGWFWNTSSSVFSWKPALRGSRFLSQTSSSVFHPLLNPSDVRRRDLHQRAPAGKWLCYDSVAANHRRADTASDHITCKLRCQQLYQLCSGAHQNTASLKY